MCIECCKDFSLFMLHNEILLSIVIPVYNVESYISRCLESIIKGVKLSAGLHNLEIIIVNDGSTDNSEEICLQYQKKFSFIKYYYQENIGLSGARNTGITHSAGKYIVFVDSDDFINSKLLPELLLQTSSDVDIVFLHAIKYYPDGHTVEFGEKYNRINIWEKSKAEVLDELTSFRKFPGSAWNKMIKKEFLISNKLFFTEGIYSEDLEWSIRLYNLAETFSSIDGIYYYYCQGRSDSITGTVSLKNVNALIYLLDKYIDFPFEENIEKAQVSFLCYEYSVLLFLLGLLNDINNNVLDKIYSFRRILLRSNKLGYKSLYFIVSVLGVRITSKIIVFLKKILI